MRKLYITTPIYYPSGKPHIGHAYTTTLADVIARYKKLIGYDVFLLTGMDEHGQKIEEAAKKANVSPQKFVDDIALIFKDLWKRLDIDYQGFIRTTSSVHEKVVQEVFEQFLNDGYLYLDKWKGLYCVSCEENYTLSQATKKDDDKLYCRVGHQLTEKEEESYFFKMSKFENWIKDLYANNQSLIYPISRVHELTNSFLNEGLTDLSVSRTSLVWGIPVTSNPKHKIYVWIDALLNYLTALGYKTKDDSLFKKYWQDEQCEVIHLMSKEITRFHCIYWPIMLKCLNLRLPSKVISHGWIITDQGKMSKSLGNVIDPVAYIEEFGADALRYYLMAEISIEKDGVFTRESFINTYNNDLANIYGNLVSRFLGMTSKYTNNVICKSEKPFTKKQQEVADLIKSTLTDVKKHIDAYAIKDLLSATKQLASEVNKFIQDAQPWTLFASKQNDELNNLLFIVANAIKVITSLLQPVLINATKTICEQMNFKQTDIVWDKLLEFDALNNHKVNNSTPIFLRKEK